MDRSIDYVIAVAECKSISQAAEMLYISQPSLSRYLSNLENELGVNLFVRGAEWNGADSSWENLSGICKRNKIVKRNDELQAERTEKRKEEPDPDRNAIKCCFSCRI